MAVAAAAAAVVAVADVCHPNFNGVVVDELQNIPEKWICPRIWLLLIYGPFW
jgi:hypothetical protein